MRTRLGAQFVLNELGCMLMSRSIAKDRSFPRIPDVVAVVISWNFRRTVYFKIPGVLFVQSFVMIETVLKGFNR